MPSEEPIIRKTDQEHLRAKILEARAGGDPRWQQKWDDLDAFPYSDTVEHQAEYLARRPQLVRLLNAAAQDTVQQAAPAPAPARRQATPARPVQARTTAQPAPAAGESQAVQRRRLGGPPPPTGPEMTPPSMMLRQSPVIRPQAQPQAQPRYTPPPAVEPLDFRPHLQENGLSQWMTPEQAAMFRR